MRKAEAVVFDLDDTLLHDNLTISDYTIAVLHKAAALGIRIIPASGRAHDSMLPFVRQIGCAHCFIACNGGEVWRGDDTLLIRHLFPDETAARIIAFGQRHGVYMQTYSGAMFYYNEESAYARAYAASSMLKGALTPDLTAFVAAHPSAKVLMMAEPAQVARMLDEARAEFAGQASVTCSKPYFLELNPPEATKGKALALCAREYGFSEKATVAFGDSINDLSMLESAGLGVAVANARPDVRARIVQACGSNEEDGPARFIAEYLLREAEQP